MKHESPHNVTLVIPGALELSSTAEPRDEKAAWATFGADSSHRQKPALKTIDDGNLWDKRARTTSVCKQGDAAMLIGMGSRSDESASDFHGHDSDRL